jgi:hypothetical protein
MVAISSTVQRIISSVSLICVAAGTGGCALELESRSVDPAASESVESAELAIETRQQPGPTCSPSAEFRRVCGAKGDYAKCDGDQAMCCKHERDERGRIKPYSYTCYADPSEIPRSYVPPDPGFGAGMVSDESGGEPSPRVLPHFSEASELTP